VILINLLPHREIARQRARQYFNVSLVLAAVAGALVCLIIFLWFQLMISNQKGRNDTLRTENAKLDQQIKEVASLQSEIAALKARQQAVESLQINRNLPVHLMNESVRQLPDGMVLRGIKQENQNVTFTGSAQSNERVAGLLTNLYNYNHSQWLTKPDLVEIVAGSMAISPKEQRRVYNFTIRAQLAQASAAQEAASAKPAGAAGKN
jgi:type IV pilus assembly protein PilN